MALADRLIPAPGKNSTPRSSFHSSNMFSSGNVPGRFLLVVFGPQATAKGRKLYPMVVCLHFIGVTLGGALKLGLAALAELEEGCVTTKSAEEVCGLLGRQRIALRKAIQTIDSSGEYAPVMPEALHKILPPAGDARREGFLRVLY